MTNSINTHIRTYINIYIYSHALGHLFLMAVAFCFKFACRAAHTLKVLHASACNNQKKKTNTSSHANSVACNKNNSKHFSLHLTIWGSDSYTLGPTDQHRTADLTNYSWPNAKCHAHTQQHMPASRFKKWLHKIK